MKLNIPHITSSVDLEKILNKIDTSVPPRTDGRTTEHTEVWVMHRYLEALAHNNLLNFPFTVEHRDKPDFILKESLTTIGIEVTEAISKQFAAYCALAEREYPESCIDLGLFRWGKPDLTIQEMRSHLEKNKLVSSGWAGDRPEQEWALYINNIIRKKLQKLAHHEFIKYHKNYLLIYDNLPLPNVHAQNAAEYLIPEISDIWEQQPAFDAIIVERGPVLVNITKEGSNNIVCATQ